MAVEIAQAYVAIVPSLKGVGDAIINAFGDASGKAGTEGGKRAGTGFAGGMKAKMGVVIGAASAITSKAMGVIGSSISSAVARADQMTNFPKVMKNLGYSADDAAKSIKKISKSLDGLPTTSSAMTGMVQQLAPLTSNLDEATTISLAFNNAMLAGGASTQEQENALAQYCQMLAAGQVDMAAWRSIQAAMPGQLNQVAESMLGAGKNANDLYDAMKNGEIGFDDFNKAVVNLNDNGFGQYASFAQQAKDATQGIGTAIENVRNRISKAVQKIVEAFGVEQIAGAINDFSSQFGRIGDAAAGMVIQAKTQIGDLWTRLQNTGAITTLQNAWDNFTATLAATQWSTLLPTEIWDQIKNSAAAALADIIERIGQLVGWLSDGVQWVTSFVKSFADTGAFNAWIDVFNAICDAAQSLWDMGSSLIDDVFGNLMSGASDAQSFGQTVGDAFKGAADVVKTVVEKLDDLTNWVSEHSEFVVSSLVTIGGGFAAFKTASVVSDVIGRFNGFREAVLLATEATGGMKLSLSTMQDALKMIGTSAGPLGPALQGVVGKVSGISTAAKAAGGGIKGLSSALGLGPWGLVAAAIAAVVSGLVWFFTQTETGKQLWQGFMTWLGDAWQNICNVAQTVWGALSAFFSTLWTNIQMVFQTVWTAIQGFVQSFIMPIVEFIKNCFIVLAAVLKTIWDGISAAFQYVWNAIAAFITPIIEQISSVITTVVNAIKTTWDSVWGAVSSFFQNIWNGISAFISPVINAIASVISSVLTGIRNTWNNIWGGISSFFGGIWDGMKSAVGNAIGWIGDKVRGIKDVVMGALSGAGNWLVDTGKNLIQGLINGISDMFGWVRDKICGLGDSILNWAKETLGIGSPSRIFHQYGEWIDEGLALGIKASTGDVRGAMDDMTGMVVGQPLRLSPDLGMGGSKYTPASAYASSWEPNIAGMANGRGDTTITIDAQGLSANELYAVLDMRMRRADLGI